MSQRRRTALSYVAIDFGTTFSGYAYSFNGAMDAIFMNKNWGAEAGLQSFKTPTCVLTEVQPDQSHRFLDFGFSAQSKYVNRASVPPDQADRLCLFDKFKMKLHGDHLVGQKKLLDRRGTTEANAITIFTMALEFMKEHFLDQLKERGRDYRVDQFQWVLTVPAIWSEDAKAFMRRAAHQAGLIDSANSDSLTIALEPEAASLYCRTLDITDYMKCDGRQDADVTMPPGTVYMIVDAGGGTVDITVHEVLRNNDVRELVVATGGAWGGTNVDAAFTQLLQNLWGNTFIKAIQEKNPKAWWDIENRFELSKKTAAPGAGASLPIFSVSMKLAQLFNQVTKRDILDCCKDAGIQGVSMNDDDYSIVLNQRALDTLFNPTVDNVINCIRKIVQKREVRNLKYIFMVGGFSSSKYLIKAVRNNFETRSVKVMIPEEPAIAVLKGAVQFGPRPFYVRTRIARMTYGTDSTVPFVPGIHDESRKKILDGLADCEGVFERFVKKGDPVKVDEVVTRHFAPFRPRSDRIKVELCQSASDRSATAEVMYINEADVEKLSTIIVPLGHVELGLNRLIEVSFSFGETEIKVKVKDLSDPDGDRQTKRISLQT